MHAPRVDARTVERLHRQAHADRWGVPLATFSEALEASLERAPAAAQRNPERYLASLHLEDLALACACAAGHERAWEHFILEHRPLLYRAADALAPGGGARELADGLYGELYGLSEKEGERRSLLRYFHGRASLRTWLRAVLSQRFVDSLRAARRLDPLPDDETGAAVAQIAGEPDPDLPRLAALMQQALATAMAALEPRDRLRLGFYYAQELTLAQTGRLMGEHEATVSRHLSRTRRMIREHVEAELGEAGLSPNDIERCFELAMEDAGELDLSGLATDRKNPEPGRSTVGGPR